MLLTRANRAEKERLVALRLRRQLGLAAALRSRMASEFVRVGLEVSSEIRAGREYQSALAGHEDRVRALMRAAWHTTMRSFGGDMLREIRTSKAAVDQAFERRMMAWVQIYGANRVSRVSNTTRNQIAGIISDGVEQGLERLEIADDIAREVKGIAPVRATIISRTETHAASSAAEQLAVETAGIEDMEKEWIAVGDDRTREHHAEADGQTVPYNEPFDVDGEELMYPGDPNGSSYNVINCRCASGYVLS